MNNFNIKKKAFTLMEMIVVLTIFFLIVTIIINVYTKMIRTKHTVNARQTLIKNSYYMMEKFNILLKDYKIDYEEYYNRKMIGCDNQSIYNNNFERNTNSGSKNGHCDIFSQYGNYNSINTSNNKIEYYYCSSSNSENNPNLVLKSPNIQIGSGCFDEKNFSNPHYQSFGQYKYQFIDVKQDVDFVTGTYNDEDDEDVGLGSSAIQDNGNIQELYLISKDNTKRTYFRRNKLGSGDWNNDGIISGNSENYYDIQLLKLKGFDAGINHDFDTTSKGLYDGNIDTWTCDFMEGFICSGNSINNTLYSGYKFPTNNNDGWINIFDDNITVSERKIKIYPNKPDYYAWNDESSLINEYFTIIMTNKLYGKKRQKKFGQFFDLNQFEFTLQSTFNSKSSYTN